MNQNKKEVLFSKKDLIILKISGAAFKHNQEIFDHNFIFQLGKQILELQKKVAKIAIVVGGGNIWRGMRKKHNFQIKKTTSHYLGMVATILNGLLLKDALNNLQKNSCEILTMVGESNFLEKFSVLKTLNYFKENKIIIFCGGSGMPFFSTDTISVIRALQLDATYLLMAKNNTDGVYNKDPNVFADAQFLPKINLNYLIKNKINIIDLSSLEIINESQKKLKIIVFNINNPSNITKLLNQEIKFSIITQKGKS